MSHYVLYRAFNKKVCLVMNCDMNYEYKIFFVILVIVISTCYRISYGAETIKNVSRVMSPHFCGSLNRCTSSKYSQRSRAAVNTRYFFPLYATTNYTGRWIFYAKSIVFRSPWDNSFVRCSWNCI